MSEKDVDGKEKKKKGLADSQDGDFILNESGTSVSNPWDANESISKEEETDEDEKADTDKNNSDSAF